MAPVDEAGSRRVYASGISREVVRGQLKGDLERLVLYERFVLDLRPRQIQARHPDLFLDVDLVYTTQRNVCDRLRRHPALAAYAPRRLE